MAQLLQRKSTGESIAIYSVAKSAAERTVKYNQSHNINLMMAFPILARIL